MRHIRNFGIVTAVALLLQPASAQQPGELPTVTTLQCGTNCPAATDPKPSEKHHATFPGFSPLDYPMEGLVVLQATITKDGALKDQKVVSLIGAKVFAERALSSSNDWLYQPATRNGVAIDRPNWQIMVTFLYRDAPRGARPEVYRIIREAIKTSAENKHAEAIAMLLPVLTMPRLNFYERETATLQLAIDYYKQGDLLTAREYLDDIMLIGDSYLAGSQKPILWRMVFFTNAQTGRLGEANQAYKKLARLETIEPSGGLAKIKEAVDTKLRGTAVLGATGRIAPTSLVQSWTKDLSRHTLSFLDIKGKLDRLTIICDEHLIESPVSDKAEWHVPKSWQNCRLDVYGASGTTFTLAEMDD